MEGIPMSAPDMTKEEEQAVLEVLQGPCLSQGERLKRFEEAVAAFVGCRYAAGVSSGTAALHLSLIAAGVGPGDLVITSPFSFVASANCILYQRAIPIFVDVDPTSGNIDPEFVREAVEGLQRKGRASLRPALRKAVRKSALKAILPIHVFGQPAEMDGLRGICADREIALIEDACEALGSAYKGRPAGSLGDVAAFGFFPNKPLTTGEGGMVVTDRRDWRDLVRSLRNQGREGSDPIPSRLGYNYRLDELSAALGLAQTGRIGELLEKRRRVASWYGERLRGQEFLACPTVQPSTTRMSWFVYAVRLRSGIDRNRLMAELAAKGIPSRPYFEPIHLHPTYRHLFDYRLQDFPLAEQMGRDSLALPFSGVMTRRQVDRVCEELLSILRHRFR